MILNQYEKEAMQLLQTVSGKSLSPEERTNKSIALTALLLEAAQSIQTYIERQNQKELASMMNDPIGKVFSCALTDQCFRSKNPARIADQIIFLLKKYGIPKFL